MTFKQCAAWFLKAPVNCWQYNCGFLPAVLFFRAGFRLVRAVFEILIGLALMLSAPVSAPLLWVFMRLTAEKRAERKAAQEKARFEDM